MSLREAKQLVQILRILGYPNEIALDTFDTNDFQAMADVLQWLVALYDPDIVIMPDLSSDIGRVEFIRSIVQQVAIRTGIRMHPRRLYIADRGAVRELLKLANPIHQGIVQTDVGEESDVRGPPEVTRIAKLSSIVPRHSVELYDAIDKELMVRGQRVAGMQAMPPMDDVAKTVTRAVDDAVARLGTLEGEMGKLSSNVETLRKLISQKRTDLDRQTKRLMSVRTIKPAFMDEYERLEQELGELFKQHFQHYRNVDWLEHQIAEQDKIREKQFDKHQREITKARKHMADELASGIRASVQASSSDFAMDPLALAQAQEEPIDDF